MSCCVMNSPVGHLKICEASGAISAVVFTQEDLQPAGTPLLQEAVRQMNAYFDRTLKDFDLPIHLEGTPFRVQCWQVLRGIPYGETISYGEQAKRIGKPGAARAVGGANHHNPIPIIVPCHRVIGADGALSGYGGGAHIKAWLLKHERCGKDV